MSHQEVEIIDELSAAELKLLHSIFTVMAIGHVDAGKTLMLSRLFSYLKGQSGIAGEIDPEKIGFAEGIEAVKSKTSTSKLVAVRAEGRPMTFVDNPGHDIYVNQLLKPLTNLRVSLLIVVVSMGEKEFNASISSGVLDNQIKSAIANGATNFLVVANKMDAIGWSHSTMHEQIRRVVRLIAVNFSAGTSGAKLGIKLSCVDSKTGDGFIAAPEQMASWEQKPKPLLQNIINFCDAFVAPVQDTLQASAVQSAVDKIVTSVTIVNGHALMLITKGATCELLYTGAEQKVNCTIEKIAGAQPVIRASDAGKTFKMLLKLETKCNIPNGARVCIYKSFDGATRIVGTCAV